MNSYGFKTREGSLYAFDKTGQSIRYEKLSGAIRDSVRPRSMCLFVSAEVFAEIEKHYKFPKNTLKLGRINQENKFFEFNSTVSLPEGSIAVVVIMDRITKQFVYIDRNAKTEPSISAVPIQKRYHAYIDTSTHVGDSISEVFKELEDLRRAAPPELLKAAGLDASQLAPTHPGNRPATVNLAISQPAS